MIQNLREFDFFNLRIQIQIQNFLAVFPLRIWRIRNRFAFRIRIHNSELQIWTLTIEYVFLLLYLRLAEIQCPQKQSQRFRIQPDPQLSGLNP
jgi:hypothetical protein